MLEVMQPTTDLNAVSIFRKGIRVRRVIRVPGKDGEKAGERGEIKARPNTHTHTTHTTQHTYLQFITIRLWYNRGNRAIIGRNGTCP